MAANKLPKLPKLLAGKIYKTGQTRGADDDVIYQNRVGRSSTVLIPYRCWELCANPNDGGDGYENSFIVLLTPNEYFGQNNIKEQLARKGLAIGKNALVFYETRAAWEAHFPDVLSWKPANSRLPPLGGQYVARVPATTATDNGERVVRGFDLTSNKGAGIRVYEYASSSTIWKCRQQLEALFWLCDDAERVALANGMTSKDVRLRKNSVLLLAKESNLLDADKLRQVRILNCNMKTTCPLCLEELSGQGFFDRLEQAGGREVTDLTVTRLNLFHIAELRFGALNHRPYNLGWGHHHCNVVVKDSGILETLEWMRKIVKRNVVEGRIPRETE